MESGVTQALILPLMPVPVSYMAPSKLVPPPLADPAQASEYLKTIWQVEAAVLALSLAAILFSFQSFTSSRFGGSLELFARESKLLVLLYLGASGLIVTGTVLLGIGNGAPGGWAATWAALISGSGLISMPFIFVLSLRVSDPRTLRGMRLRRTRSEVRRVVEEQNLEIAAANLLEKRCSELQMDFANPILARPSPSTRVISSYREGYIRDINLWHLKTISRRINDLTPRPTIHIRLGTKISPGSPLMSVSQRSPQIIDLMVNQMMKLDA